MFSYAYDSDRVDRRNVEPSDGLHEDHPRLRPLLRGALLRALPRGTRPSLRAWLRPHAAAGPPEAAPDLAAAQARVRQLHERSLPQGFTQGLRGRGVRYDGSGALAHVPDTDQAQLADGPLPTRTVRQRPGSRAYLARCVGGGPTECG